MSFVYCIRLGVPALTTRTHPRTHPKTMHSTLVSIKLSWRLGRAVRGLVRDLPVSGVSGNVADSGVAKAASNWRVGLPKLHCASTCGADRGLLFVVDVEQGSGQGRAYLRGGSSGVMLWVRFMCVVLTILVVVGCIYSDGWRFVQRRVQLAARGCITCV